jgi:ribonuclease P protein component
VSGERLAYLAEPRMRSGAVEHDGHVARSIESERFRRESRLRSSQDFQRVRRRGRRQQGQWLTLAYARRADAPRPPDASEESDGAQVKAAPARIGFSVSKRVGSAVIRNRVKRRLREAIRRRLWKTQPGWDMILIARPEAANAEYAELADEVHDLLRRARLLR